MVIAGMVLAGLVLLPFTANKVLLHIRTRNQVLTSRERLAVYGNMHKMNWNPDSEVRL